MIGGFVMIKRQTFLVTRCHNHTKRNINRFSEIKSKLHSSLNEHQPFEIHFFSYKCEIQNSSQIKCDFVL